MCDEHGHLGGESVDLGRPSRRRSRIAAPAGGRVLDASGRLTGSAERPAAERPALQDPVEARRQELRGLLTRIGSEEGALPEGTNRTLRAERRKFRVRALRKLAQAVGVPIPIDQNLLQHTDTYIPQIREAIERELMGVDLPKLLRGK